MKTLIGIPTLNNPERLARCLASLRRCTDLTDTIVLVSDDFSSSENLEKNKRVCAEQSVNMLTAPQRYGIATQWNRLTRHVPDADVVVLVNDDIVFANKDWLDVLRYSVTENPHAGMVSLRSIQVPYNATETAAQSMLPAPTDYEEATLLHGDRSLVSSSGACFAIRHDLFDQLGGFDERYLCYYEEVDFGVRAALRGYFHFVASYPIVGHEIGVTIAREYDAVALLAESLKKFTDKWIGEWDWRETKNVLGRTIGLPDLKDVTKFPSLDALRKQLAHREMPPTKHWNSQWQNWRRP
jgi:GT2 family glycosyltransferase